MTVPTPITAESPNLSASISIPAIAFGVLMVTSMLGTPPASRASVNSKKLVLGTGPDDRDHARVGNLLDILFF